MSELRDTRLEKAKALKNLGQGPYGLNFRPTDTSSALQKKYADLPNGEEKQEEVSIAGRITSRRVMGKLAFFTLADETDTIQLFLEKATLNKNAINENSKNNFEYWNIIAKTNNMIMGISHKKLDLKGLQFHPESILTPFGKKMIQNWINY